MTTKLWIYIFTLIGAVIQISLQTYKEIPADLSVNYFMIAGAIAITIATITENKALKNFWIGAVVVFFVWFISYLLKNDYATIFYDYGQFWFYTIAVIVAYRTYSESKRKHHRNLIKYSDALLTIMNLYNSSETNYSLVRNSLVYQLWFDNMSRAQKDLEKEILEGNFISDFSWKEFWYERRQWFRSFLQPRVTDQELVPITKYSLHETVKLAEEVAHCHYRFISTIRTGNTPIDLSDINNVLRDIQRRFDGPYYMYNHHLTERLHDNDGATAPQNA